MVPMSPLLYQKQNFSSKRKVLSSTALLLLLLVKNYYYPLDMYYQIPVSTEIIHEVVERIFHSTIYKATSFTNHGVKTPPTDIVGFKKSYWFGCWLSEVYTLGTNAPLIRPFNMFFFRNKGYAHLTLSGDIELANYRNQLYGRRWNEWRATKMYTKHPPKNTWKECPNDSPRTKTSGRKGHTVHHIELGPLYRLVVPNENVNKWRVKTETKIALYDENGLCHDTCSYVVMCVCVCVSVCHV